MNDRDASTPTDVTLEILRQWYGDQTLAVLCDWLEWERPAPLRSLVWASPNDAVQGRLALAGEPALTPDERALRVAVAERLLATLPERRDTWADAGEAAELDPEPDALTLWPRRLFEIDWAEPGSLFIDTETYYVTHLPGFEVVGVAVVADAVDRLGCRTLALGWFPASWPVGVGVRQVVLEWWGRLAGRGATRWQRLLEAGEIEAKTVRAWAQSVWGRSVPVAEVVGVGTALSGAACKPGSGCADGPR